MIIDSYSFPHPVLGIFNDIAGDFNIDIHIERNPGKKMIEFRVAKPVFNNEYFSKLIESKTAGVLIKLYCGSTFKTWVFIDPEIPIEIPEDDLCNKVEIEPLIIALTDIEHYSDSSFNSVFEKQIFSVGKNEIIGILGKITIPIDKDYERLGLGNIFEFEPESDFTKPCSFDYNRDKILIKYPPAVNGDHPPNALFNKAPYTAYNMLIIPALTEAFRIMTDKEKVSSIEDNEWFFVLNNLLPIEEREDDPFVCAQLVLNREIPILKSFEELCLKN